MNSGKWLYFKQLKPKNLRMSSTQSAITAKNYFETNVCTFKSAEKTGVIAISLRFDKLHPAIRFARSKKQNSKIGLSAEF
jgi:hypothetical protein